MTATHLTPNRSDKSPQAGHATSATSSSTNPNVPTTSPTPFFCPIRSVITNETELLRKTRKEMEKSEMPSRYVIACNGVVDGENGRRRRIVDMIAGFSKWQRNRKDGCAGAREAWFTLRGGNVDVVVYLVLA